MAKQNPKQTQQAQQGGQQSRPADSYDPGGMAGKSVECGEESPAPQQQDPGEQHSQPVGNYNPGGQAGKSVEPGKERPAPQQQDPGRGANQDGKKQNR